jgi:SAM-dependent methyltransferase
MRFAPNVATRAIHVRRRAPDVTTSEQFEFAALSEARNYRKALVRLFAPHLQGRVLEIGAGIGQMTSEIKGLPHLDEIVSVEPDPAFCQVFRKAHPQQKLIAGTVNDVPKAEAWNAILSVNVLEHIREDQSELETYRALLTSTRGALCLFVPARPEIYAPIDRAFGHYRRYTRAGLSRQLNKAGFVIERLCYFNFAGYFGWWLIFRLLKKPRFNPASIRWFDRIIFPPMHWLETKLFSPPFGQSLLAIAKAEGGEVTIRPPN